MPRKKRFYIDSEIGVRLQTADQQAWTAFFKDVYPLVYGKARNYLKCPCDAEDATQEVFIALYKNISKWDPSKGAFGAWFRRLMTNRITDIYRSKHRKKRIDTSTALSLDFQLDTQDIADSEEFLSLVVDPSAPDPLDLLITTELENKILNAYLAIPRAEHRMAFRLKHFDNYSYTEVSKILGCTLAAAKMWIIRAKASMRKKLITLEDVNA